MHRYDPTRQRRNRSVRAIVKSCCLRQWEICDRRRLHSVAATLTASAWNRNLPFYQRANSNSDPYVVSCSHLLREKNIENVSPLTRNFEMTAFILLGSDWFAIPHQFFTSAGLNITSRFLIGLPSKPIITFLLSYTCNLVPRGFSVGALNCCQITNMAGVLKCKLLNYFCYFVGKLEDFICYGITISL